MLEIVEEFYRQHPEVFAQAEWERIQRELESKRDELSEALKQSVALEDKIAALRKELETL